MVLSLTAIAQTTHAASTPVGIAIPLYTYPTDGTWTAVIQAKQAHPNVPFLAVINPNSGPGGSNDPNYVQGIKNLQAVGIKVLGYVATGYGANSQSSVESQAASYHSWYGVDGIFFDEMSNTVGFESYYSTLNNYVHSLISGSMTMGNPGTSVPTSFIGTMDVLVVYESGGYPPLSFITYPGFNPSNFASVSYGVAMNAPFLASLSGTIAWVYTTDANLPNPYDVLPAYFASEVSTLSTMDGVTSTTTGSSTPTTSSTGTSTLTLNTQDTNGAALNGYWMALYQNGQTIATGYSPVTFTLNNGQTYTVESDGYGSCAFSHWLDTGSTSAQRTVSIVSNTALTSVLSCGSTTTTTTSTSTTSTTTHTSMISTSTTKSTTTTTTTSTTGSTSASTTSTSTISYFTVKIKSAVAGGSGFSGVWMVVYRNGAIIKSGYTPLTFTATDGGVYTISASNYGRYVFSHWSNGSTDPSITIKVSKAVTLTAYYVLVRGGPGFNYW